MRDHGAPIQAGTFTLHPRERSRSGRNPFRDLATIAALYRLYRREHPDIVHHVALKPSLYGALAAWMAGVPAVVNAFTGMGFSLSPTACSPVSHAHFWWAHSTFFSTATAR